MKIRFFLILALISVSVTPGLHAAFTLRDGRLVQVEEVASLPAQDHYEKGIDAWNRCDWWEAIRQFRIITTNYPRDPLACEVLFFIGAGSYYVQEYDCANYELSEYLKHQVSPEYLEETMEYKFAIAEAFRCGAKRRIAGSRQLPKWLGGYNLALDIYDEVICTLPCHELAAEALYSKGILLDCMGDYRCSVEAFQSLVRRFPDHDLAIEAYLHIIDVHLHQAHAEPGNPDILPLTEIALERFEAEFPNEPRLNQARCKLQTIKELYAYGLCETGQFFERVRCYQAAVLYYSSAVQQFPDTKVAEWARRCLCRMSNSFPCLDIPEGTFES